MLLLDSFPSLRVEVIKCQLDLNKVCHIRQSQRIRSVERILMDRKEPFQTGQGISLNGWVEVGNPMNIYI